MLLQPAFIITHDRRRPMGEPGSWIVTGPCEPPAYDSLADARLFVSRENQKYRNGSIRPFEPTHMIMWQPPQSPAVKRRIPVRMVISTERRDRWVEQRQSFNALSETLSGNIASSDSWLNGVRFKSSLPGQVVGVRFYKAEDGPHEISLWDASSTLRLAVRSVDIGGRGWRTIRFDSPVNIPAGREYIAAYLVNDSYWYYGNWNLFPWPVTVGPLTAINNAWETTNTFPTQSDGLNYGVDLVFDTVDSQLVSGDLAALYKEEEWQPCIIPEWQYDPTINRLILDEVRMGVSWRIVPYEEGFADFVGLQVSEYRDQGRFRPW